MGLGKIQAHAKFYRVWLENSREKWICCLGRTFAVLGRQQYLWKEDICIFHLIPFDPKYVYQFCHTEHFYYIGPNQKSEHFDDALLNSGEGCTIGVVNSKKFCIIKCFSADFTPKATDLPSIFCLASIWSCKAASKSEAPKSTLLFESCSNKKILADLLYQFKKFQ